MSVMKIGCLQMGITKGDPEANLAKVRLFAERAHKEAVDILLLPEMWSSGFAYRMMPGLAEKTPAILDEIGQMARDYGMVIAGSMPESSVDRLYNTLFVVDAGGTVAAAYRKIHLFPLFKEDMFIEPGESTVLHTISGINTGLAICFDLRFPELFRKLAIKRASLVLVSAQWPMERLDHWRLLVRARAVENQIFVAAANNSGRTGRTTFAGHSMIVGPEGKILAEGEDKETIVSADINPADVDVAREKISYLACRRKDADEFLTAL